MTSTVGMKDENKGRVVQKAKVQILIMYIFAAGFGHRIYIPSDLYFCLVSIFPCLLFQIEIVLGKSEKFDLLMNAANGPPEGTSKDEE